MSLEKLALLAKTTASEAGRLLAARPRQVQNKGVIDLVTEVDLASETLIRALLLKAEPSIPVQGEETGGQRTGLRWVVDPLDGTTNFVHGYPFYCVSIGLCEDETPLAGCIYDPVRHTSFWGWKGGGAFSESGVLQVSTTKRLSEALGVTGFPYSRRDKIDFYLDFVGRVLKNTHGIRRSGSAAMDLATLACGQADFFWEFGLNAWDTAAGALLVQEAGGVVSCLDGGKWGPSTPEILACNPYIYQEVQELFKH
jgi:myo-inositol-1(or 4)-monophosphatase